MKKILFSAFDAGGGNAIFPVVKSVLKNKQFQGLCIIGGPSKKIFEREGIKFIDSDNLEDKELIFLVKKFAPDLFISGTNLGPTFDKKILFLIKKLGAKSIYILDFWANYWQRFSEKDKDFEYLPDIICVMDKRAKKEMVEEGFASEIIKITGNPYFDYFLKKIKKGQEKKSDILFVSQPFTEIKNVFEFNEFIVLDDILEALGDSGNRYKVIIRPHPRERELKFKQYLNKFGNIKIDSKTLIEKLISSAGLIIGMNSMVLLQAAIAGKKVISYQPNLKTKDVLISNDFGLSKLIVKKNELKNIIKKYFDGKSPATKKVNASLIIKNATKNIINLIKKSHL